MVLQWILLMLDLVNLMGFVNPANATNKILKIKYPVKPFGENPIVSTFHFKILDLAKSLSNASDADGFGTIRCRHKKYQPYIQIITAIGSMNTIDPNISTIFFVRNLAPA